MAGVEKGVALLTGDILTCLGDLNQTWESITNGRSGLVKRHVPLCVTDYPLGIVEGLAGEYGCENRLRNFLDLLLNNVPSLPPSTQLFVATTKGAVDELATDAKFPEPHVLQPWSLAKEIHAKFQLTPEPVTVSGACASGTLAVIQAAMAIESGRCTHALIVAIDLVAEFVLRGFDSFKALSTTTVMPFDADRDGLALGDGGAWLLMSADSTLCKDQGVSALLKRWGVSCDATHITAPCRKGSGLSRVFQQILTSADTTVFPVGGINGHGTGTVYNDAMEMLVFDEQCGSAIPFCSVKGAIGHSLGAAGLIETLLSIRSLQEMKLPPTVGLVRADGGRTNVSGTRILSLQHPSIISCNSGFGGINAGLYLSPPDPAP